MRMLSIGLSVALSTLAAITSLSAQETYPNKPVRIIVPFAAGGPSEAICRVFADALTTMWKQPVILEAKPGAGTIVGMSFVANAKPDGYTLGFALPPLSINQAIRDEVPYDLTKDFAYISQTAKASIVLVANPKFAANTVAEMVDEGKKAGGLTYTSPGVGTAQHLLGELIGMQTGVKMKHIPYGGSAPALTDVLAGRVPLFFDVWVSVKPHVEAGTLKVIAVANNERMKGYDYPTISETVTGLYNPDAWSGFIAPAGTPKPIIDKLVSDFQAAAKMPQVIERLQSMGIEAWGTTPQKFEADVREELKVWQKVGKEANIRIK